ncbi:MAG: class F sortase [Sporichthyaceae bacterium]
MPRRPDRRRAAALVVAAGCAFAGVGLVSTALADQVEAPHRAPPVAVPSAVVPSSPSVQALPPSPPIAVSVPSIGVGAVVGELGRNADGTVEVPTEPTAVGWYRHSPTPGSLGPAVLLGHVDDDRTGPAIFFRLSELQPGQVVHVTRADGRTAVFTVDDVREVPKDPFPTTDVYGNTDHSALRLITCANWDHDAGDYRGNTVAFAHLTGVL